MANIKVKRSSVAGKVPTITDLALGEIAVNTYDGLAFIKKSVDGVESIVALGGLGGSAGDLQDRSIYIATSGQTTFSAQYSAPYVDVYLNGVLLSPSDYTATNGTSVILGTGAVVGDIVQIIGHKILGVAGTLALSGGTMTGAINFDGSQTWPTFNQNTTGSAATLTTPRTIAVTGDVAYTSAAFDGSGNVTGVATLSNSGVTAGTYGSDTNIPQLAVDSKGRVTSVTNVAVSIPSGALTFTGDVTGTGSTGATTDLTLAATGTAGTYTKVTTDSKGRVTSGTTLVAGDIPSLDASKIISGTIDAARLPSYVDDVVEAANLAGFPATGETGKIYVALDTNKAYRWSGSTYVYITSGAVDSVAGRTGVVTLTSSDVGLGSVDNTSDAAKPVSTAQQTALNLKANLASPTFTGTVAGITAAMVGLGSVENKSSATIRSEITSSNVTTALGFTPYNSTNPSGYITSSASITGNAATATTATTANALNTANSYTVAGLTLTTTNGYLNVNRTSAGSGEIGYTWGSGGAVTWYNYLSTGSTTLNWYSPYGIVMALTTGGALNTVGAITQNGSQVLHAGNYNTYALPLTGGTLTGAIDASGTSGSVGGYFGTIKVGYGAAYGTIERTDGDLHLQYNNNYNVYTGYGGGFLYAYNSVRSPVYYDSDDTAYYVNPSSSSNIGSLTSNSNYNLQAGAGDAVYQQINSTGAAATYAYLQLTTTSGNGYLIRNRATGNSVTDKSLYLWNDTGPIEFVPLGNAALRTTLSAGGSLTVAVDVRAPAFYDSNDTTFYVDPNNTSTSAVFAGNISMNGAIVRRSAGTGYLSGNYASSENTTTTGAIYTIGGSFYPTSTGLSNMYGIGYTYASVAGGAAGYTGGSSWGLYVASNGTTRVFLDSDTGRVLATGDMRAPIFYDSNDTSYYVDPNGTSKFVNLGLGGATPDVRLSVSGDTHISSVLYLGGTAGTVGSWGSRDYTTSGLRYFNASTYEFNNYGYGSTYTFLLNASYAQHSASVRAPIFYDSDNTAYYVDPNSISTMYGVHINGSGSGTDVSNQLFLWGSGGTTSAMGFKSNGAPFNSPTGAGDGYNTYLTMDTPGRGWVFGERTAGFVNVYTSGWILNNGIWQANASMRSPIFYDSNNTGYYVDPTSSTSANFVGSVSVATYNYAGLLLNASGTGSTGSAIALQQVTAEGWTGIFVDYEPNAGWGLYHDNPNNYFCVTAETTTGNFRSFVVPSRYSGNRTAYEKFRIDQNNGDIIVGGISYAYGSSRAPIFYDYDNTGYYIDPASTSDSALRVRGGGLFGPNTTWGDYLLVGGDGRQNYTNSTTVASICTTDGNLHIDAASGHQTYLNFYDGDVVYFGNGQTALAGSFVGSDGSFRSSIFYDYDNTAYYLNPASTSNLSATYIGGHFYTSQNGSNPVIRTSSAGSAGLLIRDANDSFRIQLYGDGSNYGFLNGVWAGWDLRKVVNGNLYLNNGSTYYIGTDEVYMNRVYGVTDIRSPIFYDNNNTGYYLDPASTSNLNVGNFAGSSSFTASTYCAYMYGNGDTGSTSGVGMNVYSSGGSGAMMAFHRGGYYAVNMGLDSDNVFRIGGWSAAANRLQMDMSGNLTMAGNVTAYSDEKLKTSWTSLPNNYVEQLADLLSGTFTRTDTGQRQAGVGAQSLQKFLPEVVAGDTTLSVAYGNAAMVSAVALAKRVVAQDARIAHLELLVAQLLTK